MARELQGTATWDAHMSLSILFTQGGNALVVAVHRPNRALAHVPGVADVVRGVLLVSRQRDTILGVPDHCEAELTGGTPNYIGACNWAKHTWGNKGGEACIAVAFQRQTQRKCSCELVVSTRGEQIRITLR